MIDVVLKKLDINDIELVRNWRNSSEVSKYMYTDFHISKDQQENWFQKINNDNSCIYWIIEYENKKIGLVSITEINSVFSSCSWAFYLGDTSLRGLGIGGKIEYKVIDYVFNVLKLNKLKCEVIVSNEKVIKMHEKFGFRREAYYREHFIKNFEKIDVVGLALLKSDWEIINDKIHSRIYKF